MKTTTNKLNLTKKIANAILVGLFVVATANSQSFSLQAAKVTDKVAQSKFFAVDSNKVLNEYAMFAFNSPVVRIQDSLFVIDGIRSAVSSAKNSNNSSIRDFSLEQNYPNPFNPSTTIRINVGKKAKVSVALFDVTGKEVTTLVNDNKEAGSYSIQWNGTNSNGAAAASGAYFYRLIATSDDGNTTVDTKKMTLMK